MPGRSTRESEEKRVTREEETRADDVWSSPSLLEAPPARPGFRQKWVSTSILGKDIPHHTMKRFREGWTPRPADTVPKDFHVPTIQHGQFQGYIGVEGMILCEIPEGKAKARQRFIREKNSRLSSFVENNLQSVERKGGIPIIRENSTGTSFGKRRVSDDE